MATARKKYEFVMPDEEVAIIDMVCDRYSSREIARWLKRPQATIVKVAQRWGISFTAPGRDAG